MCVHACVWLRVGMHVWPTSHDPAWDAAVCACTGGCHVSVNVCVHISLICVIQ